MHVALCWEATKSGSLQDPLERLAKCDTDGTHAGVGGGGVDCGRGIMGLVSLLLCISAESHTEASAAGGRMVL